MASRKSTTSRAVKRKVEDDFVQSLSAKTRRKETTDSLSDDSLSDNNTSNISELEKNDGTFELESIAGEEIKNKPESIAGVYTINDDSAGVKVYQIEIVGKPAGKGAGAQLTKEIKINPAENRKKDAQSEVYASREIVVEKKDVGKTADAATFTYKYECHKCLKLLGSRKTLNDHLSRHSEIKCYECDRCGLAFSNKANLTSHYKTHLGIKDFFCEICGKGFARKATLNTHLVSHSDERKHACDRCDKTFKMRVSLLAHMNVHEPGSMLVCHECGKSFSSHRYLLQHMKSHSGTMSWECGQCKKRFQAKQSWEEHVRRHNGQKNVPCKHCSKKFYNKKELWQHMRYHNNVTEHKCQTCHMYFKLAKSLEAHISRTHGEQYLCSFCDQRFSAKRFLQTHIFKEHKDLKPPRKDKLEKYETANFKKVPCVFCDQMLSNKYRLLKHIVKKHGKQYELRDIHGKIMQMKSEDDGSDENEDEDEEVKQEVYVKDEYEKSVLSAIEKELASRAGGAEHKTVYVEELAGQGVEHVDRPIIVIYEGDIADANVLSQSGGKGLTSVPSFLQNSIHSIKTTAGDVEGIQVSGLDKLDRLSGNEEIVVIVNSNGEENVEVQNRYHNLIHYAGEDDMFDQVAEEIEIQPVVREATETSLVQTRAIQPVVREVTESGVVHQTLAIQPVVREATESSLAQAQAQHNATESEDQDEPEELQDTQEEVADEEIEETGTQADAGVEPGVLDNILPQTGSAEEFAKFEKELARGFNMLRHFDRYGEFLNNVLDFVQVEKNLQSHKKQ